MDILKILHISGISLQLVAGSLFLLERLGIKPDNFAKERSKQIKQYAEDPKIAIIITLVTIFSAVFLYFFISSKLTGESLSNIEVVEGMITAFVMALGSYALAARFALWIADKTGINKRLSKGTQSEKLIRRNVFLSVISALPALTFLAIFFAIQYSSRQEALLAISALLFGGFASIAVLSLLISFVFYVIWGVANYFGKPKRFWLTLFTMWLIGGVCLLSRAVAMA